MSAAPADALGRVEALLDEPARERARAARRGGCLDLIGGDPPPPTGTTQMLMLTRAVPLVYERWWRPTLGRIAKGPLGPGMRDEYRIARLMLALAPGDGVLDVACGPGNFTRRFARTVRDTGLAVGIDASPTMLARAVEETSAQAGNVAFVRGDAVRLPFRDAAFDAVCCFAALHLFAEPMTALDHMTRVLTPGGRLAIMTSCRTRSTAMRTLDGVMGERTGMRMFEHDEITDALRERGLANVRQLVSGFVQFVGGRKRR